MILEEFVFLVACTVWQLAHWMCVPRVFPRPRKRGTGEGRHHSTIPFSTHPPKHPHPLFLFLFFYSLKRSVELTNTVLTALHCSLFTALCSLLTAHCSLLTARCSLLTLGSHENFNVVDIFVSVVFRPILLKLWRSFMRKAKLFLQCECHVHLFLIKYCLPFAFYNSLIGYRHVKHIHSTFYCIFYTL